MYAEQHRILLQISLPGSFVLVALNSGETTRQLLGEHKTIFDCDGKRRQV